MFDGLTSCLTFFVCKIDGVEMGVILLVQTL
jgi:hypothetical protein